MNNLPGEWDDNRGVSPILGLALVVVLTAILASIFSLLVLNEPTTPAQPSPTVSMEHKDGYVDISINDFAGHTSVKAVNMNTGESVTLRSLGATKSLNAKNGDKINFIIGMDENEEMVFSTANVFQSGDTRAT